MSGKRAGLIRWMKFNLVGAGGICVQLGTLALLISALEMNYLLATTLAVEAAVLHNFFWHERFTWLDRGHAEAGWTASLPKLLKFNLSTGALSIIANLLAMKLLVGIGGLQYLPANLLSIAGCSVLNFFVADRLVFLANATERQSM